MTAFQWALLLSNLGLGVLNVFHPAPFMPNVTLAFGCFNFLVVGGMIGYATGRMELR